MEKGAVLLLLLLIVTEALLSQSVANPVECQDSEYLDDRGKCSPCKECGPGFELSKECGYGEGRNAQCTPCQPRKFKDRWGHHGCKSCLSCSLVNRAQKFNCSATSDATCGECFPGFYSKTQIGGSQDLECVPCTKQTPSSEQQCLPRIHLEESSTDPAQDLVLVVLTSSALVLLALVLLTISILYCQQFWKSQCQHVFLRSQNVSGQRSTFPTSAPTGFLCHELLSDHCSLDIKNFSSSDRPIEGLVKAVQFTPGMDVSGFHLPRTEPDTDLSKLTVVTAKTPPARSLLETQPLIQNSGSSNGSGRDSSVTEFRQDCSRDTDGPAKLSSCARELQHRWSHSPVECTELDLQTFSTWAGKRTADTEITGKQELPSEVLRWSVYPAAQAGLSSEAVSVLCSSFQNPTIESGEHPDMKESYNTPEIPEKEFYCCCGFEVQPQYCCPPVLKNNSAEKSKATLIVGPKLKML